MHVDDVIAAVDWLATLPDVDRSAITLYGRAAEGMVALHAAALDVRIARAVRQQLAAAFAAGAAESIRLVHHGFRDPMPID